MSEPFGRWLVAAVGVAFAIGALAVARRGWTERFDRLALSPDARRWAVPMGRIGFFARAFVFLIVAGFLMLAALLAPSSGSGLEIKEGKITRESALAWLTARGDLKPRFGIRRIRKVFRGKP
jgi:hypothetical protein